MVLNSRYLVILCATLYCCGDRSSDNAKEKEEPIEWITGTYHYSNEYGVYTESWEKTGEYEYTGKGYFLHSGDTSFLMRMKLFRDDKVIKMDYNVKAQNEGKNVQFVLTKHDKGLFVFENPFRGFPSIMQYKLLGDTAINIVERGYENNKDRVQDFIVIKSKD